ncbi:hypothetical protein L873DRAFT_502861 [Choiromyces venosus 120613-1]|uniref:Uncharacterized protein n=1 Tax=Choiromyces venosus 120613-1 TaxID=1336337 RepID=A0A3N4IVU0_9PEZI|nr:hypothetical protein L873DRAFT_502861 [Choiromyces venosus 120613-1]
MIFQYCHAPDSSLRHVWLCGISLLVLASFWVREEGKVFPGPIELFGPRQLPSMVPDYKFQTNRGTQAWHLIVVIPQLPPSAAFPILAIWKVPRAKEADRPRSALVSFCDGESLTYQVCMLGFSTGGRR